MPEPDAYDVAVIGAGPAGAAIARRLAQHGCRVLLVERGGFDEVRVGETLAPSVQPLLAELGVWDRFLALDPLPSWGTRSLWGGSHPQEHSHIASPYGCGWHVDRRRFDCMLADAAVAAGAMLRTTTQLLECNERSDQRWSLSLRSGTRAWSADACVVVDATGRNARLGQRLGARRVVLDRLVAVTAQFTPIRPDEQCYTLVETTADGWWYSAPVGDGRLMVMLMTDSDLCRSGKLTVFGNLLARLRETSATAARTANASLAWGPRVFSAVSQRLRRPDSDSRWLAVGDSTLAVDPASGSGVVRALRTAAAGAVAVMNVLRRVSSTAIDEYETERERECSLYLQQHVRYYGLERRWSTSPFWRRRASVAEAAPFPL